MLLGHCKIQPADQTDPRETNFNPEASRNLTTCRRRGDVRGSTQCVCARENWTLSTGRVVADFSFGFALDESTECFRDEKRDTVHLHRRHGHIIVRHPVSL